mmetsp:Transcript_4462/g.7920  ORF Transcript_4462/g.7920 Transcript_4462/m.7920 type:complete len:170 (-) Transcript_4462:522-1031(-)
MWDLKEAAQAPPATNPVLPPNIPISSTVTSIQMANAILGHGGQRQGWGGGAGRNWHFYSQWTTTTDPLRVLPRSKHFLAMLWAVVDLYNIHMLWLMQLSGHLPTKPTEKANTKQLACLRHGPVNPMPQTNESSSSMCLFAFILVSAHHAQSHGWRDGLQHQHRSYSAVE